jgi:hypothetical protein
MVELKKKGKEREKLHIQSTCQEGAQIETLETAKKKAKNKIVQ